MNNKKRIIVIRFILSILIIILFSIIIKNILSSNIENEIKIINTKDSQLFASYSAKFRHIDFYKTDNNIIINVYSEGNFDRPNQIIVPIDNGISKEDITAQVNWEAVGGKVVDSDSDSIIAANIRISYYDEIIYDGGVSLIENAWEIWNNQADKYNKD